MSIKIIEDRLKEYYTTGSRPKEMNAIKEIYQEIALAALAKANFFKFAAFHGGTCLRIIHQLNRFSEDLDFTALAPYHTFSWEPFLIVLQKEFTKYQLELSIIDKSIADNAVKKAFLKDSSFGKVLVLKNPLQSSDKQSVIIKLEIDTNPPGGAHTEMHQLNYPVLFSILTEDKPSLFAGKCLALLCREYTKGRDWYDFNWYVSKKIIPNYEYIGNGLNQNGPWEKQGIIVTPTWLVAAIREKIAHTDWHRAKLDAARFVTEQQLDLLDTWDSEFFLKLAAKLEQTLIESTNQ